jgi:hypothetical protein
MDHHEWDWGEFFIAIVIDLLPLWAVLLFVIGIIISWSIA